MNEINDVIFVISFESTNLKLAVITFFMEINLGGAYNKVHCVKLM